MKNSVVVLIVTSLMLLVPSSVSAECYDPDKGCGWGESQDGIFCYTVYGGEVTIEGATVTKKSQIDLVIPEEIAGMPVTEIAPNAFRNCHASVGTAVIPDSVITIGTEAFRNINLQRVTFGSGVAFIGYRAFRNNDTLTRAYFFGDAPVMEDDVFGQASNAFSICHAQWSQGFTHPTWYGYPTEECILPCRYDFECPPGHECVDGFCLLAFSYFFDLNGELVITGYIGTHDDVAVPEILEGSPVAHIGAWAFYGRSDLTSVSIEADIKTIGAYAFAGCSGLTSVAIPAGVERIDSFAFYQCDSLTGIDVPAAVTSIGLGAFSRCAALSAISVHGDNPNYSSLDGVLYSKDQSLLIQYPSGKPGAFSIPTGVGEIEEAAFAFAVYLTSVDIPASVLTIGRGAFSACPSLTAINVAAEHPLYSSIDGILYDKSQSILALYPSGKAGAFTVPGSVTRILDGAFAGCLNLTGITIPASVTRIGDVAFESCIALTSVVIPDSVTLIGRGLFYNCIGLTDVTLGSGIASIPDGVLFETEVAGMFSGCTGLQSIIIPATIMSIGNYAFYGCSALTDMYFLGDAPAVGLNVFTGVSTGFSVCYTAYAFGFTDPWNGYPAAECYPPCTVDDDCPGEYVCMSGECRLETECSVDSDCPDGAACVYGECQVVYTYSVSDGQVTITGYNGIGGEVVIPPTFEGLPVVSIGQDAFRGHQRITGVIIPDGVVSIGRYAFRDCPALVSAVLPSGVISIGDGAFLCCRALQSINIPDSVETIGRVAFWLCRLNTVVIGSGVRDIGYGAFMGCTGLTQLVIGSSVEVIGENAFLRCTRLEEILIPATVAQIGDQVFSGCNRLSLALFEGDAPIVGADVFAGTADDFIVCHGEGAVGFTGSPWDGYNAQSCACIENSDCSEGYVCAQGLCMPDELPVIIYGPVPTVRSWMWYGLSQDPGNPTPVQTVQSAISWLYDDDFGTCGTVPTITGLARYRVLGGSWVYAPVVHWWWVPAFATHLNEVPLGVYEFESCVVDCADQTACSGVKYIEVVQ